MPLFIITYSHPDPIGWQQHLMPHIGWLQDQLVDGSLIASGPFRDEDGHEALLIMQAEDAAAMRGVIDSDPFMIEGQVADLSIRRWDPIFGAFNAQSSMPGQMQQRADTPAA
jgi:uncharacterized protein YciI